MPAGYVTSKPCSLACALSTEPDRLMVEAAMYGISHAMHIEKEV